jgi:hypothetical protein
MKTVEIKIHPGKEYRVENKEYEDLVAHGLVSRVIADDDAPAVTPRVQVSSAPVAKKTGTKKTSSKESSESATDELSGSDE